MTFPFVGSSKQAHCMPREGAHTRGGISSVSPPTPHEFFGVSSVYADTEIFSPPIRNSMHSGRAAGYIALRQCTSSMGELMGYALLACRLLIGGIFVVSAVSKLRGRSAFLRFEASTLAMGVPRRFLRTVAGTVLAAECAIPLLLLTRPGGLAGFLLAGSLLTALTLGLIHALRQGTQTSCACFGSSDTPIGRHHVVRNGALLAAVALGVVAAPAGATAFPAHPGGLATAAFAALAGILLVLGTDELAALLSEPASPTRRTDAVPDRRRRDTGGAVPAEPPAHLRRHP
ncbi:MULTISPECIES: MauE/DoxX family redox-associated membrane protein [unclassified Streptomyces]|uniref:MauE/DoxX family redox-associated membrane protein n=1 Tax=unclassified Streptomyces TaxID=2593676 RepID=UPI00344E6550